MSLHAMPVLILNFGGEMLYILQQRLTAQKISAEKSARVLQDVVSAMFGQSFLDELLKPHRLYTTDSTKEIFTKLAHASIMRLNKTSMDKLYDLMTMGFKHQLLNLSEPRDILQVTMNHIDAIKAMVTTHKTSLDLIARAQANFLQIYAGWSRGQFYALKMALLHFLQDRRVKVSLFLQERLQNADGTMVLTHRGALPEGGEAPGLVRGAGDTRLELKNSQGTLEHVPCPDVVNPDLRTTSYGCNVYTKPRKHSTASTSKPPPPQTPAPKRITAYEQKQAQQVAKAELNLLADLIQVSDDNDFEIVNLFPDDVSSDKSGADFDIITFDSEGYAAKSKKIEQSLQNFNVNGQQDEDEEDDLLALMDNA